MLHYMLHHMLHHVTLHVTPHVTPWVVKELDWKRTGVSVETRVHWLNLFAIRDVTSIANMLLNGFRHFLYFAIFSAFKQ